MYIYVILYRVRNLQISDRSVLSAEQAQILASTALALRWPENLGASAVQYQVPLALPSHRH